MPSLMFCYVADAAFFRIRGSTYSVAQRISPDRTLTVSTLANLKPQCCRCGTRQGLSGLVQTQQVTVQKPDVFAAT